MNGLLTGGMSPDFARGYMNRPSLLGGFSRQTPTRLDQTTTPMRERESVGPWKVCPACVGKGFPSGKVPDLQAIATRMGQHNIPGAGFPR